MITLDSISKNIAGRTLFENVTISFLDGCRYGLTGPNGSGKSTLLKIMMGLEEATTGRVFLPKKVGFLKQNIEAFRNETIIDVVIQGNKKLYDAIQKKEILLHQEMTDEVGMQLAEMEEIILEEDGYTAEPDAEVLLVGMGIDSENVRKKMHMIPTDQQFRVLLCQALYGHPQALLLDEPTNHLDLDSIGWLEEFLKNYTGTLIVISHDRHFLNNVCTHIADIDYETIILYTGNYDDMILTKTQVRTRADDENKIKEKKIAQLNEFIAKFSAGTRASQVQSRIKEIEKLQPSDLKKSNIQKPYIRFTPPEVQSGKIVFRVEGLSKGYDGNPVIKNLSFEVHRGDKVGVIGNNGLGKTTLMKLLAGVLEPDSGSIQLGHNVSIGYFPQNHSDIIDKTQKMTLFDYLKMQKTPIQDVEIRSILGKMLFSGDDAFKEIHNLSGGETARLIIGSIMLKIPNTLVLDEPNNHLDIEAVSALTWGLEEFRGTAVFASHDRDLISKAANKLIVFEKDKTFFFDGPYEEYLEKKKKT
jgi:ATPase subunit of ABC transporter with duplicated ATPase domains